MHKRNRLTFVYVLEHQWTTIQTCWSIIMRCVSAECVLIGVAAFDVSVMSIPKHFMTSARYKTSVKNIYVYTKTEKDLCFECSSHENKNYCTVGLHRVSGSERV